MTKQKHEWELSKGATDFINGRPCVIPDNATSEMHVQYLSEWGAASVKRSLVLIRADALGMDHQWALRLFGLDK